MCSRDPGVEAECRALLDDLGGDYLEVGKRLPQRLVPCQDLICPLQVCPGNPLLAIRVPGCPESLDILRACRRQLPPQHFCCLSHLCSLPIPPLTISSLWIGRREQVSHILGKTPSH